MSRPTRPPATMIAARVRARLDDASVLWRRSLQLRVVVSTFALSAVVLLVLGLVLQAQITNGLLEAQTRAALEQTRNSQRIVESELAGVDPATDELSGRLNSALNRLASSQPQNNSGDSAGAGAGLFRSVLIDGGGLGRGDSHPPYSGQISDVPVELRVPVQQGKLAHKITTLHRKEGSETVIAVGVPVASAGRPLQLYLLFPLSAHQQTLALVQNTLLAGGALLTLLLAGIAGLVTRQVVQPVRQAAEVAERFSSGH